MRFRHAALLGMLLLFIPSSSIWTRSASGQSATTDIVHSNLVEAFVLVQEADLQGASQAQISLLSNNLNLALVYEENATLLSGRNNTASYILSSKSVNVSAATSVQAQSIANSARSQALFSQVAGYSLALAAGFGCALFVLEFHRFSDFVRAMRLRRVRLR
jgi:hypothetical protein